MPDNDLEKYTKALIRIRDKAIPFAMLNANNTLGRMLQVKWKRELQRTMTLRNTWTLRSVKLVKSRKPDINTMRTIVGSRLEYLRKNEDGGAVVGRGKHGLGVPTNKARTGNSYKRLVARPNRMRNIFVKPRRGKGRKQRNAIQIREARKNRKNVAMLELSSGGFGFFKTKGSSPKSKLKMIWAINRKRIRIDSNPAMKRAVRQVLPKQGPITLAAMKREVAEVRRRSGLKAQ